MLDKKYLEQIAPIVKDKIIWDAFNLLLDYEIIELLKLIQVKQNTDMLIRINAKLEQLNQLKKYREKTQ